MLGDIFCHDDLGDALGERFACDLTTDFTFLETRTDAMQRPVMSALPNSVPGMSTELRGFAVGGFVLVTSPPKGILSNDKLIIKASGHDGFKSTIDANGDSFTDRNEFNRIHCVGRRFYSLPGGALEATPHYSEFREADKFPGSARNNLVAVSEHATISRQKVWGATYHKTPVRMVISYMNLAKHVRIKIPAVVYAKIPVVTQLLNTALGNHLGFLCTVPRSWLHVIAPECFAQNGHCHQNEITSTHASLPGNTVFKMKSCLLGRKQGIFFEPTHSVTKTAVFVCSSDLLGAIGEFFCESTCKGLSQEEFKSFMKQPVSKRHELSIMTNPQEFAPVWSLGYAVRVWKVHVEHDHELDEF